MPTEETPTEPRAARDQPDPAARLRAALSRPSRAQAVVGVLLAVLGFAAVVQVRTTADPENYTGYREQDLIDVLTGLTGAAERAEAEIARLEERRDDLLDDTRSRQAALEQAREEAVTLGVLAGTLPVQGPGLRLTLTPVGGEVLVDTLLDLVQGLRTADAEAMEFNDQVRVVASTAFSRSVDGGLLVGGQPLTAPFTIEVIGSPETLQNALTFGGGPEDSFREDGVELEVEVLEQVVVESVVDVGLPEFAQPDAG